MLEVSRADLPNPPPLGGGGPLEQVGWRLRRVGVYGDKGLIVLDLLRPRRVAIGNIVICDDPEIFLSVFKEEGRWALEVHNPSPVRKSIRVEVPDWVRAIPPFRGKVEVDGGRSVLVRLGRG